MPDPSRYAPCATALLAAALLASPASAQLSDIYPVPLPASGAGFDVIAVDLDLDGRVDVVNGDVQLGTDIALPAGGFAPTAFTPCGLAPSDLTAGDVDGNGFPDVVGCSSVTQNFAVALTPGDGTLLPTHKYYVGGKLNGVGVGDLDSDGLTDVVSSSDAAPVALQVNLADGSGGFQATQSHPLAVTPYGLQLADFDSDGKLDAAFESNVLPYSVSLCLGDGAGGFGAPVSAKIFLYPHRLVVSDVDLDGDLDLVLPTSASTGLGHAVVVQGDGAGGLAPAQSWLTDLQCTCLAAGDLDGDGLPELVTNLFNGDQVSVLRADGAGGYLPAELHAASARLSQLLVAEASGDAFADVLGWSFSGESVAVMVGDGAGGLQECERYAIDPPVAVAAADLDADGHVDLVAVCNTPVVATLFSDGAGGFLPPALADFPPYPVSIGVKPHVAPGDVTGDGRPDLLVASQNVLVLFANDGAGGLKDGVVVAGSSGGFGVALADLDGDGDLDAVEAHDLGQFTAPYPGVLLRYLQGAHGLQPPASFDAGSFPIAIALGDVDDDGHPDTAVANYFGAGLSVLPGDGTGGFGAPLESAYASNQDQIALGDLDLDGHLDAATIQPYGKVTMLRGDGQGSMHPIGTWLPASGYLSDVQLGIGDVDGDGWPDVVEAGGSAESVDVWRNDGTGALLPALRFAGGDEPRPLALADVDGDHRPDVLAGASTYAAAGFGKLSVLRNGADFRWTDLGSALPGALGAPQLAGTGALVHGTPGDLRLFHARPLSLAVLFIAGTSSPAAFKGGTLVPVPPLLNLTLLTDGAGSVTVAWSAWPSSGPGQDWYFQYAIKDPTVPHGVALSNALKAVEP